jgi:hypothetical protein
VSRPSRHLLRLADHGALIRRGMPGVGCQVLVLGMPDGIAPPALPDMIRPGLGRTWGAPLCSANCS